LAVGELQIRAGKRSGLALVETARLEELADAGDVLCTGTFRTLAEEVAPGMFHQRAEVTLRGLGHATDAWRLDWQSSGRAPEELSLPPRLRADERPFVGRTAELAKLAQAWQRDEPDVDLVLVGGEAGIGKSALLRAFARELHEQGTWVLYGRCEPSAVAPFGPFAEAHATFREQTGGAAQLLGRSAPLLDAVLRAGPDAGRVDAANLEAVRFGLFDAVVDWMEAISSRERVLLVIDDLTWADEPTIDLLQHVLRSSRGALLVVASYRTAELEWSEAFAQLMSDRHPATGAARDLHLDGLDVTEIAVAATQRLGSVLRAEQLPNLATQIRSYTGGNPLFVNALLDEVDHQVSAPYAGHEAPPDVADLDSLGIPASVSDLLALRRDRLSEPARNLLDVAALLGATIDPDLAGRVAGLSVEVAPSAVDELVKAGLLRSVGAHIEFVHDIVGRAATNLVPAERTRELHVRIALELERHPYSAQVAGELSQHLAHSASPEDRRRAVEYAVAAGDAALASLAPAVAVRHFATALELADTTAPPIAASDRCDLAIKLGAALKQAGDPAAKRQLVRAARVAEELRDGRRMGQAALATLTDSWAVTGASDDETVRVLEDAVTMIGESDLDLRARLLAALSAELTFVDGERRQLLNAEALRIARRLFESNPTPSSRSTLTRVLEHRHTILLDAAGLEERARVVEELDTLTAGASPMRTFTASSYGFWTAMERGDVPECRERLRAMRDVAEQVDQPRLVAITRLWQSAFAAMRGRAGEALRLAEESHAIYLRVGRRDALVFDVGLRYLPLWFQGQLHTLVADLDECAEAYPLRVGMRAGLAHARARTGATDAARRDLDAVGEVEVSGHQDELTALALATMTSSVLLAADRERGSEPTSVELDRLARIAELLGPWRGQVAFNGTACFGAVSHYLGVARSALRDWSAADELFRDAAERHTSMSAPALVALTKLEWARMLLDRHGLSDAVRARILAEEALTMAHSLGLEWIGREAHVLLSAGFR
jgi:hypothetical protein